MKDEASSRILHCSHGNNCPLTEFCQRTKERKDNRASSRVEELILFLESLTPALWSKLAIELGVLQVSANEIYEHIATLRDIMYETASKDFSISDEKLLKVADTITECYINTLLNK